jgi:hypothetical protein
VALGSEWVLPCGETGTCEAAISIVHRGGPLTPFEQAVAVDFRIEDQAPTSSPPQEPLRAATDRR